MDGPRVRGPSCGIRVPELGLQNLALNLSATCVLNGTASLAADRRICRARLDNSRGQAEQGAENDQRRRHVVTKHEVVVSKSVSKERSLLYKLQLSRNGMLWSIGHLRDRRLLHDSVEFQCRSPNQARACFPERGCRQSMIRYGPRSTFFKENSRCKCACTWRNGRKLSLDDIQRVLAAAQSPARGAVHSTKMPRSYNRASRLRRAVVSIHIFCCSRISEEMLAQEQRPIALRRIII